jgi:hypothetical protein
MKKICLTLIIVLFLFSGATRLQAQTTQTKLNQIELIKQFIGNWKGEIGKDTTAFWEIKSNGTGIECNFKYVTKDKIIMEGSQLWAYDNKIEKFIFEAGNSALWFTSKNKSIFVQSNDLADPDKASAKLEMEFKSPDVFLQRSIVNKNIIKTDTYNRIKN